jgi:hypothetical protein
MSVPVKSGCPYEGGVAVRVSVPSAGSVRVGESPSAAGRA